MKKLFQVALGIIAAIGGFVDIGELVFNTQAGADFRYQLLWAVPVGVIGIVVFAEMTGRVATVSGRPVFDVVRMRMGLNVGLVTLVCDQNEECEWSTWHSREPLPATTIAFVGARPRPSRVAATLLCLGQGRLAQLRNRLSQQPRDLRAVVVASG